MKVLKTVVLFATFLVFQGCYDALKETLLNDYSGVVGVVFTAIILEVHLFC